MRKLTEWLNQWGLYCITLFFIAFIPLYPKLPLIDINQTWVYIRLEDLFIAVSFLVLFVYQIRIKKIPDGPLMFPIVLYWVVGLISLIHALLFIFPHLSGFVFPHLAFLHYARRIEYVGLFFVAYQGFRTKSSLWPVLIVLSISFLLVLLYGMGQKLFGFPAFLTMNEEFAKGVPLRLPSTARIPSTFGGHYDLAAYLVFMIPIIGSMIFGVEKIWQKILFFLLSVGGLIILLLTASRISFGVYLIAISGMLFWHKKFLLIPIVIICSIIILNMTSGASERFYKTFRVSNVVVDLSTGKPIGTLDKLEGSSAVLEQIEKPDEESLPKGSGFINLPQKNVEPISIGPTPEAIQTVELFTTAGIATGSGEVATISGSFLIQKALVYDISITTRFQGQWPKAIEALKRNIFLGSGYSTLSVAADGDYHRMLGETGIIGTIAFLGIFAAFFSLFFISLPKLAGLERAFAIGVVAGLTGLLVNAVLIDVFEASKVAYTLWMFIGLTTALFVRIHIVPLPYLTLLRKIFTHPIAYVLYMVIFIIFVWNKALSGYFIGDDFTWLRWAAQSTRADIVAYFTESSGFFYRPIPKLWYYFLFSIFWLKPFAYHGASLFLFTVISIAFYISLQEMRVSRLIAWFGAIVFATLSIHHEVIFWISCQSHLLSMTGLTLGIVSLFYSTKVQKNTYKIYSILIQFFIFISLFSYDPMIVAPIIIWFLGITLCHKKGLWHATLLWVPLYLLIHYIVRSVGPEGDYGYKLMTFLPNAIGNTIGYISAIIVGPNAMDFISILRPHAREYSYAIVTGAICIVALCLAFIYKKRQYIVLYKVPIVWFVCFLLSLSAYYGLGNISERYTLFCSWFFIGTIVLFIHTVAKKSSYAKGIVFGFIAVCVLSITYNTKQIPQFSSQWEKAGMISQQALLAIKTATFPPKNAKTFVFINTPIRYGRAWIFPTGLTDAIWHMYRMTPFIVYSANSIQEAYGPRRVIGDLEVFIFDEHYILKRGLKETKVIQEK